MRIRLAKAGCLALATLLFSQNAAAPRGKSAPKGEIISEEALPAPGEDDKLSGEKSGHIPPDLPGWNRPETERCRKRYLSPGPAAELFAILKGGEPYRHYVRRRLLEEGMPLALV